MPNPKSLVVKSGQKIELSEANTPALGGLVVQIRPRTADGLRTLLGQLGKNTARLHDDKHFEQLKKVDDHMKFVPDKQGNFNGLSVRGFLAIVRNLPHGNGMPKKVEVPIVKSGCGCKGSSKNTVARTIERSVLTDIVAVDVPEWLRNLRFYLDARYFEDIEVEAGGVLILDQGTVMARNLILHRGSRVEQQGMVTLDLAGSFRVVDWGDTLIWNLNDEELIMTPEWDLRGSNGPDAPEFDSAADSGADGSDGTDARCGIFLGDVPATRGTAGSPGDNGQDGPSGDPGVSGQTLIVLSTSLDGIAAFLTDGGRGGKGAKGQDGGDGGTGGDGGSGVTCLAGANGRNGGAAGNGGNGGDGGPGGNGANVIIRFDRAPTLTPPPEPVQTLGGEGGDRGGFGRKGDPGNGGSGGAGDRGLFGLGVDPDGTDGGVGTAGSDGIRGERGARGLNGMIRFEEIWHAVKTAGLVSVNKNLGPWAYGWFRFQPIASRTFVRKWDWKSRKRNEAM
jgi:hypothetical protein